MISGRAGRDLEGAVVVVTGGSSGIGLATVDCLRSRGATAVSLDVTPPAGEPHGQPALGHVATDVSDQDSVDRAVQAVIGRFGRLDAVINNAGIGAVGDVAANADDEWHRVFDVNVVGIVRMMRACLPHLRAAPAAAVVNTCSVAATVGLPRRALYSATKGAVQSLTLAMAADHLADRIRVNCVNPGTADTPWVQRLLDAAADPQRERVALETRQPIGRLVTADEVANAIAYLASPLSGSTTGTVLSVDGGLSSLRIPAPSSPR